MPLSGPEVLQGGPLSDQLLMADQAVTALLVRLDPVLVAQSSELLPQSVEDGMVVVQGTEANDQTLTEVEDLSGRRLDPLQQQASDRKSTRLNSSHSSVSRMPSSA